MPNIRLDFTGDLTQLNTQILGVIQRIDSLNRSASAVYAQRGDAGMIGLQRQIGAAKTELDGLLSSFAQISGANNVGALVTQFQSLTREINRAVSASLGLKAGTATSQDFILNDAVRQQTALAALQADKKRYYDQDIANQAAQAAAQRKATQDALANLKSYQKEQDRARQEQEAFAQKLAPSQPIGTQREELKHQYDAATASAERLKNVQDGLIAKYNQIRAAGQRTFAEIGRDMEATPKSIIGGQTAQVKYDPSLNRYVEDFRKIGAAGEEAWGKAGLGLRHLIAIFDESQRGQRGAMIASSSAFIRDVVGIENLIKGLTTPWGAVAAAGIAAAVAIGVAFEQTFQKIKATSEVQTAFAFKGGGTSPEQYKETEAMIERINAKTHEWAGTTREVVTEVSKIPLAARAQVEALSEFGIALGQGTGQDPAKAIKPLISAMDQGVEAAAKFIEKEYGVTQATDGSNRSLDQQLAATKGSAAQWQILVDALTKALGPIIALELKTREQSNSWTAWAERLRLAAEAADGSAESYGKLVEKTEELHQPVKDATIAETEFNQAQRDLEAAIKGANSGIVEQTHLLAQMNLLLQETAKSAAEAAAQQNAIAKVDTMSAQPGEEKRHKIAMDNIDEEAKSRAQDPSAQLKAAQARSEEILRTQINKRVEAGDTPENAEVYARQSEEFIKSQNEIKDAARAVEKERIDLAKDANRAIIQDDMIGTAARVAAQKKNVELAKEAFTAGVGSREQIAQEEIKLQTLIRQERTKTFQEARDNARAEVELAKGNVAEIIAAYDKLYAAAQKAGLPPAATAQIDREKVRDLESAQQKAFSAETEFNSARERLGELQIATEKARLATLVAAHKMSKDDMFRAETEFTQKVMADNEARIANEIANDNITDEQKAKLYGHLAELYQKDAELQIQNQEKATQAIEAENKKREALFTKMFDSIGSESEKAIEGLFDRGKTHHQIEAQFLGSVLKTVGTSAASELSDIGGEKLGPMLGLKPEESKGGIGQVLGSSLFKALGLEKDVPTDKMGSAADKMKSAMDASMKAAELTKDSAKDLKEAAQALKQLAGQKGVPSNYGTGGGTGGTGQVGAGDITGGPVPAQASAAVSYAMEHTGEKLKAYCATLVNESLEKAGVKGSGSGLASSFGPGSNFGTPVSPGQVRAGDVFYSPSSGWGDTGHVGFTTGPVSDGRVPVMSSHMQGDPSNPAGPETRSVANLTFRRPAYDESQMGSSVGMVTLSPDSSQTVATGVLQGQQQSSSITQTAIQNGVSQGNTGVVNADDANKQATDKNAGALDKNTSSVDKNTSKISSSGPGGGGGGDSSTGGANTALNTFKDTVGTAASAVTQLGGRFGQIGNAINRGIGTITQISSGITKASSDFDLLTGTTKAASTAQTLAQSATTLNATAVATDTTAMQTNAAAAASSGGGGILGGLFKIFGFAGGGIVPSAAGGFIMPSQGIGGGGQLSILHPQEMVLPAGISSGLQNMIGRGGAGFGGGGVSRDIGEQPSMSVNYTANVTGYHPFNSAGEFESMLRNNSASLFNYFRNELRNFSSVNI